MRSVMVALVGGMILTLPVAAEVSFPLLADRVEVVIDGRSFTALHFGKDAGKPFLHPLRTAGGDGVTRGFPMDPQPGEPTDHPHQRGLWIGHEHLSSMDFWENDPSYSRPNMGRIEFVEVTRAKDGREAGTLATLFDWISKEGARVLTEKRSMVFYGSSAKYRMFDIDVVLLARQTIKFEDHHDAVIGMRLSPAFDERNGGKTVNPEGFENELNVCGRQSKWLTSFGTVNGKRVGVTLMDHPANLRFPGRWHVRSFGLVTLNPFAEKTFFPEGKDREGRTVHDGTFTLTKGNQLHLRYRVLLHDETADLPAIFEQFAKLEP